MAPPTTQTGSPGPSLLGFTSLQVAPGRPQPALIHSPPTTGSWASNCVGRWLPNEDGAPSTQVSLASSLAWWWWCDYCCEHDAPPSRGVRSPWAERCDAALNYASLQQHRDRAGTQAVNYKKNIHLRVKRARTTTKRPGGRQPIHGRHRPARPSGQGPTQPPHTGTRARKPRKETATVNWQRRQISQRRPETGLNWPSLVVPAGSRQLALAR